MHRLGVIGKPSDWLIASNVNYTEVKSIFNIELIDIDIEVLTLKYNKILENCSNFNDKFEKLLTNIDIKKSENLEIQKALILYIAIKDIINEYGLDGITIRCFDLLNSLKTTSCLAFALLNKEDYIATCEGDIPAMISMFLIKKYLGVSSFQANPSQIFVEENEIILAHCTIPCDMCKSISTDTHFESGIGIGIKGELYKKEISIFKINSKLDQYVLLKGSISNNLNYKNLCRTQVKIKLNKESNVSYFLKRPLGNHHIIFYGNKTKELEKQLIKLKRIF